MQYRIPAPSEIPSYLSFLQYAENIDDLEQWLSIITIDIIGDLQIGATVTGIYEFKLTPDSEGVRLIDTDQIRFIAPNLAAPDPSDYKFLRAKDSNGRSRLFLCCRGDDDGN